MGSVTTIADWQHVEDGYVVDVTIRKTDDETYPCGWRYSLHVGEIGGHTVVRYDNAHEQTKGHERHTRKGIETIEFHGMLELYERFKREVQEMTTISWHWSR